ncbi:hypothetical protein ACLBYG_25255 [Methylobacterium sp. D53M]
MDEARKRYWDVALGVAAPVLTVLGLLTGVWQFSAGERNKVRLESELQSRKDIIEFQRKLWLEKLEAYKAIVALAGKIAAAADQPKEGSGQAAAGKPAIDGLWRDLTGAYWGQKLLLEDDDVAKGLRDFYDTVRDFRDNWADTNKVKMKADALAEACRGAIRRSAPQGAPK